MTLGLLKQASRRDLERLGELLDNRDGWIAEAPLNIADIGSVDAGAVSIIFLAPAFCVAQAADV